MGGLHFKLDWQEQKWDALFVVLLALSLFLWDVSMNKVADFGTDFLANITGTIHIPMIIFTWIGFFGVLGFTVTLIMRAIMNREGNLFFDASFGLLAMVSFAFLLLGGVLQIYHIDKFLFFTWDIFTITMYHIVAIGGYIIAMIYYVVTE